MPEFAGLGTSLVLIVAVVLWVAYLVPVWTRKREYLATERNAIRLQQTLRIMAESQEAPEEVRLEVDARTVAVQQKAVAKEQRLKQALEHAKAVARARELDEQIKAVEREVRAAVKSSMSRTQRLRRTRLACFALVLVALLGVVAGALVPAMQVLVAVGAAVAVLGVVGLVAVNASAQRMRRVAASTAPQVRTLVEARKVAAEAVAAEERVAEQVVARQSGRVDRLATAEVLESRSWSPQPVPEQRARVEYKASDDLLQRAREQLNADRRALSGPVARVTRLEPSFDEIVTGEIAQTPTETERRLAPTQPALPIRELPVREAVAQAEALEVVRAAEPLETQQDEHPIRREQPARRAPATSGSRFASMGLVDDDLADVDVHAAFARRVG